MGETFNKSILEVEKQTIKALISQDKVKQYEYLTKAKFIMKVDMWTDIRFLMVNKAITPGEITDLIRRQMEINNDLEKWILSIQQAISAQV